MLGRGIDGIGEQGEKDIMIGIGQIADFKGASMSVSMAWTLVSKVGTATRVAWAGGTPSE